jgi:hypothetical protein
MNQATLFDDAPDPKKETARARRSDPDTSRAAAARTPVAALEDRVLRALRVSKEGMTTHELAWLLKLELVSVSPRMRPLAQKNLVRDTGERRASDNGRSSIVWKAI